MWFLFLIYPAGMISAVVIAGLIKYFLDVHRNKDEIFGNSCSSSHKFYYYTFVNISILVVWIFLALEAFPFRNHLSNYGAPIGAVLLLLLIPLSLLISYMLNSKQADRKTEFHRYIKLSKMLWLFSVVPGAIVVIYYGLMMLSDSKYTTLHTLCLFIAYFASIY